MEEGELLKVPCQHGLRLRGVVVAEQRGADQVKPILLENLRDLAKGHQILSLGLLKGLQLDSDGPPKVLRPTLSVGILLGHLAKHLAWRTEHIPRLAEEERVDGHPIHTRSEEDPLAHASQVPHKRAEGLLGRTGIVHRHLARDDIELGEACERLEILRRGGLALVQNPHVAIVLLKERLGHVSLDKEGGWQLALGHLLQVADTGSLTGALNVALGQVEPNHLARLRLAPLVEVIRPSHGQLQQGISLGDRGAVQLLLDAIVEAHHIHHGAAAGLQTVPIVELVFKGIVGRARDHGAQHRLRDGHVNVRPDVLGHMDIISKLRLSQSTVPVRLVVARAQDRPPPLGHIADALNDGIGLHPRAMNVLGEARATDGNVNHKRIRRLGGGRLEGRRGAVPGFGQHAQFRRNLGLTVFPREGLAGVDNVRAWRATHKERPLAGALSQHGVKGVGLGEGDQEVNGVLVCWLPLVDPQPRVALAVGNGSHCRGPRREDETIGWVLERHVENRANRLLHGGSVASQEDLGLNTHGGASGEHEEVFLEVLHEEHCTAQARLERLLAHIGVRGHERETRDILAPELVGIKDAEQVAVGQELTVHDIANVHVLGCANASPGDAPITVPAKEATVPSHHQEAALSICLVGDRVAAQDAVGPVRAQVAPNHRHGLDEAEAQSLQLEGVALKVRIRDQEGRLLVRGEKRLHGAIETRQKGRGRGCLVKQFHFQLVDWSLVEELHKALLPLLLGLDERHVNAEHLVRRDPALAVQDAGVRRGVHRRPREVLAERLFVPERSPELEVGNVNHILPRGAHLKVPPLALNLKGQRPETRGRGHGVEGIHPRHRHAETVGVGKGGAVRRYEPSRCHLPNRLDNAVRDILGLDLS